MATCNFLVELKRRIENGEDPDKVIPYTLPFELTQDEYIEVLFFAKQVLPDGVRRNCVIETLEELTNVSRRDGKL